MDGTLISNVPYLIVSAVSIALMVWSFLSREKYRVLYANVSVNYENVLNTNRSLETDLALAKQTMYTMKEQIDESDSALITIRDELKTIMNQKKSSEVRLGKDAEVLTPFLDVFNYDPKHARFIGEPLDFIIFDPDKEITFVEVKSGNSKLSPKQNQLKKLIEDKKVKFDLIRVKA